MQQRLQQKLSAHYQLKPPSRDYGHLRLFRDLSSAHHFGADFPSRYRTQELDAARYPHESRVLARESEEKKKEQSDSEEAAAAAAAWIYLDLVHITD